MTELDNCVCKRHVCLHEANIKNYTTMMRTKKITLHSAFRYLSTTTWLLLSNNNIGIQPSWAFTPLELPGFRQSTNAATKGLPAQHPYAFFSSHAVYPIHTRLYISSFPTPPSDASSHSASKNIATWEDESDGDDDDDDEDVSFTSSNNNAVGSDEDDTAGDSSSSVVLDEWMAWSKAVNQATKKLQKKYNSLESEFSKAQNVEQTVERAQLIVSNLYLFPRGTKSAMVPDWENDGIEVKVDLNPKYSTASEESDALFAQARKLKRGSQILQPLLDETKALLGDLEDMQQDLESANLPNGTLDQGRLELVKERLIRSARSTGLKIPDMSHNSKNKDNKEKTKASRSGPTKPELGSPASNIRKLSSPGGCTVLVGRNRRGNEHLSLSIARQNDVWMHSRGCPGAHVVIQNRRGGPTPTEDDLQFAADLAIFYSDLRTEAKAPVSAAEPKHLLKPRGAPLGAIKVREEWRTFVGRPDRVPEELKEARDLSGQSDEYRQEDKGKHRRRTKQASQEEKARRRRRNKKNE